MGWTLAQWYALPIDEREMWLARDKQRQRQIDEIADTFQQKRTSDSGREYSNWTAEVAIAVMLQRI